MKPTSNLLISLLLGLWAVTSSAETERAHSHEVVEKVEQAIALLRADGERALAALSDPHGDFVWKDTYVFVVDCEADKVVANPAFPGLVGRSVKRHGDYVGYPYGEDLCRMARGPAGAWIEYFWLPRGSETPVRKLSYVRSASGTSYQVGAGVYDYGMTEPRRYRGLDNDH